MHERQAEACQRKGQRLETDAIRVTAALEGALAALRPVDDALARVGGSGSAALVRPSRATGSPATVWLRP